MAMAANAVNERKAIAALVSAGWDTARYGLVGGITSATCNPVSSSYAPRSSMNVCWTFTCAYSAFLYQVLGVRPKAVGSELVVSGFADANIPIAWTCKPEQYGSGDGCQCACGAFDPDCNPMAAPSLDCPNHDDICIPGQLNQPICTPRHEVSSMMSTLTTTLMLLLHVRVLFCDVHFLFRSSAIESHFKLRLGCLSMTLFSTSPITLTLMVRRGATTAVFTRFKMCRHHGPATLFSMAPRTAAIASVELGTLTAMQLRHLFKKFSIVTPATRKCVA